MLIFSLGIQLLRCEIAGLTLKCKRNVCLRLQTLDELLRVGRRTSATPTIAKTPYLYSARPLY